MRFSAAIRGYDRDEVDRYMNHVNRLLAELQFTSTPESAIRHALESVSAETNGMLEGAQLKADDITRRSRSKADDRVQEATQEAQKLHQASEQEAAETRDAAAREAQEVREAAERHARKIREAAEARVRELETDAEAMREERVRAIGELRELVRSLDDFVDGSDGGDPGPALTKSQADGAG